MSDEAEELWSKITRDLPESFWDGAGWQDNHWLLINLDIADRKRIGRRIVEETLRQQELHRRETEKTSIRIDDL